MDSQQLDGFTDFTGPLDGCQSSQGRTELPEPQPTSFVQSLARLALVLERNGQAGTGSESLLIDRSQRAKC